MKYSYVTLVQREDEPHGLGTSKKNTGHRPKANQKVYLSGIKLRLKMLKKIEIFTSEIYFGENYLQVG